MRHSSFQGRRNNNGGGSNNRHRSGGQQSHSPRQSSGNSGNSRPHRNQIFDSNGPDVRVRGTAFQINEKYMALGKDAASSGDLILAENYLQHAEHYQRLINEFEPIVTHQPSHDGERQSHNQQSHNNNSQPSQESSDDNGNASSSDESNGNNGNTDGESEEPIRVVRREPRRVPVQKDSDDDTDLGLPSTLFAAPDAN